jgi:hypothetical protein
MNGANEIKQSNPLKGRSGWRFLPIDGPVIEKKERLFRCSGRLVLGGSP